MTFNEFYSIVDFLLLLGIILRLIWVSIFESARTPSHTEFLFFVVIITLQKVGYYVYGMTELIYMFIHSYAPLFILANRFDFLNKGVISKIVVPSILGLFLHINPNLYITSTLYLLAILHMLYEGYKRIDLSRREREKIIPYIAVAIYLANTQLVFMLKLTGLNWYESNYIIHHRNILYIVFLSTNIILHVRFRRLFID